MFDCHIHVFVMATLVVFERFLLRTPGYDVIVKSAPFTVAFGVDKDRIVAAVIVVAMYQYSVQRVIGRIIRIGILKVIVQRYFLVEFDAIVEFY